MQVVALVVGVLAFGPLAVRSFDHLTFSPVEQCGPFSISLTGSKESPTLPLTLTVIPFNSSAPLSIPISAGQWQDMTSSPSGANISFLPFAAGTSFVASVDDVNGQAVTTVSDVIGVQPSNTSSCVSANTTASYPYTLTGTPTQCGAFNVSSDPNVVSGVKSVRAFIPKGPAFLLNRTSPNSSSYVMSVKRGLQVVMLVSDGSSHQQTTSLETVQGDSTSSTACLPVQSNQKSAQQNKPALSSGAIIAIAVGSGGAVLVLGFVMLVYIRRERRARNTRRAVRDNEKGIPPFPSQPPLPPLPPEPPLKYGDSPPFSPSSRFIRDAAPYGNDAFLSPTSADHLRKFRRYSMSSAGAGSPHASMGPPSMAPANMEPTSFSMGGARRVLGAGDRSVHSLDIEQMLEMATR
ncbi:hypothetical protein PLICRDRAFT_544993 [Plicaturopsis crispa FD-325 SS-3]|nr:hypothetical protein PLICRDRAFT_544993 [Plicaturopsis crispa FD-325 SS-3]